MSFLKESTGEAGKHSVLARQGDNSEHCLQGIDDKLSYSTDSEGDTEMKVPSSKLLPDLMTEFLTEQMGQDYGRVCVGRGGGGSCYMILISEPGNLAAKEFLSLIEETLLKGEAQNQRKIRLWGGC